MLSDLVELLSCLKELLELLMAENCFNSTELILRLSRVELLVRIRLPVICFLESISLVKVLIKVLHSVILDLSDNVRSRFF